MGLEFQHTKVKLSFRSSCFEQLIFKHSVAKIVLLLRAMEEVTSKIVINSFITERVFAPSEAGHGVLQNKEKACSFCILVLGVWNVAFVWVFSNPLILVS